MEDLSSLQPSRSWKKSPQATKSILVKTRTCLRVFPGNAPLHFTWKSPLVTCSPGLHTAISLTFFVLGSFCRAFTQHLEPFSLRVHFPFKLVFWDWLFTLLPSPDPSSRFEAAEARVICEELSKEIFLGRNEYFPVQTFENSLQYLLDVPRVWEY